MSSAFAHSTQPIAAWAEVVPGRPCLGADDLAALPDDGWQYELVQGVLIRMPMSGGEASKIAARLLSRITVFVEDHELGDTTGADGGYRPDPAHRDDTELAPDVAFVQAGRAPERGTADYARAWPLAPDLAVEVASPHQYRPAMGEKAMLYLSFSTRLVWVVWPRYRQIDVWHPGDIAPSATLSDGDVLHGEDVVPGFSYPVARLFA